MNDIKRYEYVGHSCDGIEPDNDGEFVTFDDYEKRVNGQLRLLEVSGRYNEKLEKRIAELESHCRKIFKIVSCFNGGRTPVGFDGMIMLKVDEYNALVNAINEGIK